VNNINTKHDKINSILRPDTHFTIQNKAMCFLPGTHLPEGTAGYSVLGAVQGWFKCHGSLYYFLLNVFAPVLPSAEWRHHLRDQIGKLGTEAVILNLGSGPQILKKRDDIINVDLFAFDSVDIVANATNLPLKNNSVDLILNMAMLEHVPDARLVINEMLRVLRPGGVVVCYLPFMCPFHAAPHDYQRWTISGIRALFSEYDQVEAGVGGGPTSGMLWITQEWLAILLSFGSRILHDIIFLVVMVVTSPIKLLDIFLARHPNAEKIASGFYVVAKKHDIDFDCKETR
jgi:SAM-dependent methyltransferase